MRIDEWTKRLGQQHWNIAGKGQTLLVILPPPLLNYLEEKEPWS
jgi:hypothetical protein